MAAWGPLIAGAVYDVTRSYGLAFQLSGGANLAAAALVAGIRPPRRAAG
jgi:cyanate permease